MKIESVDFFYLSMPLITLDADGSQDALLVRVRGGQHEGWGECEAAPLVSIAAYYCPASHGACQPVSASVEGQRLDGPDDITRIAAEVRRNSMDLLQAAHTFSGIEIALWDLLGKSRDEPVWKMLGYSRTFPKRPYASLLLGDTPQDTLERCRSARGRGFSAVKVGWGRLGQAVETDADHFQAAREGIGPEGLVLIDAGQIWEEDVESAAARLPALEAVDATWLEEPFQAHALDAYRQLSARSGRVGIAGGEAAHNAHMAKHLIDFGNVSFIQIDCGRIGGIGPAKIVADYAAARGVKYVNHTFTSHLALSASLQPFGGLEEEQICEYPADPRSLALDLTANHILPDADGKIHLPEAPGLGITIDLAGAASYLVSVEIDVGGHRTYSTPSI